MAIESDDPRPHVLLHRHRGRRPPHVSDADELSIHTIRAQAIDTVETARSGHLGRRAEDLLRRVGLPVAPQLGAR
jgi:hypothetical protein